MDDLISRQTAFKSVHSLFKPLPQYLADKMNVGYNHALADTLATLKALPSAERHGRWIDVEPAPDNLFYATCSVCGDRQTIEVANYCPMCGASMEGSEWMTKHSKNTTK